MNQALGLYLIETIPKLDSEAPDYVANMLSLIEAILEDPTVVIRKQVDKIKTALVAQMKEDGVDYDDRLEALEEVEHPKPGKDFIYQTYNDFVLINPWAKEAGVRPKSIVREMFEDGPHSKIISKTMDSKEVKRFYFATFLRFIRFLCKRCPLL
jgi:uncharacterized protein (UPF0147 family)